MKLPKLSVITAFYGHVQPASSAICILSDKFSRYLSSQIMPKYRSINSIERHSHYNFSTNNKSTIDEFRSREEQKEEDFSKTVSKSSETTDDGEQDKEEDEKLKTIRLKILEASMPFVTTHGWTRISIAHGAEKIGYPGVIHGLFPDGGIELIRYFYSKCNQDLVDILLNEINNNVEKKIKDPAEFLVNAVKLRLQMIEPYIEQWPQALAKLALPQHVPKSLAQLLTLIDDICYYSGDKSVDIGWYTRRVGLATIYKMTELYMLQDSSIDRVQTWAFLKNRMDEATHLEAFLGNIGGNEPSSSAQNKLRATFETARNILGLSYDRR